MKRKYKIEIKKSEDLYAQCNFCLETKNIYDAKCDRLTSVVCICPDCAETLHRTIQADIKK